MLNWQYLKFKDINLEDSFFDSLKEDYSEFSDWFERKCENNAYVFKNDNNEIDGFLYHKIEEEAVTDISPPLPPKKRLKIGTFKVNAHGTRLGERFIKKSLDFALLEGVSEVYVTIFPKHEALIDSFKRYGFREVADKTTTNGVELVLLKQMGVYIGEVKSDYPYIDNTGRKFILSLYPEWHSRLLPDSILNTESKDAVVKDISHTNSIHKVYLTAMSGVESLCKGDILVIYRTSDKKGPAHYRSVATSICVVEETKDISCFSTLDEFIGYTASYSIFKKRELEAFYSEKKYPTIIKFCYNVALSKRVTRGEMIDDLGMSANQYWGFFELTESQFEGIIKKGKVNESLIINKA
ncbi:N-acetyltransferase [Spartinivicinus ruber]|uniref:N-acetyltransferase n=1 Tax=Spartinivicinus ruber TaxID=2683272 RepID=UPI0013D2C5AA|nr:N-acetyltransferase [Spartinivicinus ruber]